MTKMRKFSTSIAIFLGSIAVFIWSALSWAVLPCHEWTFKSFTNPEAVAQVIKENAKQPGVYSIPSCENHQDIKNGPLVLSAVRLQGIDPNVGKELFFHFFNILFGTACIGWLLKKCVRSLPLYLERVLFVIVVAFAGAILTQVPLWNWHFFSFSFVLMDILDQVVGYFFAGLIMAAIINVDTKKAV